jgi:CheY-like chemotaxis protein
MNVESISQNAAAMDALTTILLIEDDDVDAMSVERALETHQLPYPVVRARDGLEALEMLHRHKVPSPMLIMLDINLPRMNGQEFLLALRADPRWHDVPVYVVTTSEAPTDRERARLAGVSAYITKQHGDAHITEVLQRAGLLSN